MLVAKAFPAPVSLPLETKSIKSNTYTLPPSHPASQNHETRNKENFPIPSPSCFIFLPPLPFNNHETKNKENSQLPVRIVLFPHPQTRVRIVQVNQHWQSARPTSFEKPTIWRSRSWAFLYKHSVGFQQCNLGSKLLYLFFFREGCRFPSTGFLRIPT